MVFNNNNKERRKDWELSGHHKNRKFQNEALCGGTELENFMRD